MQCMQLQQLEPHEQFKELARLEGSSVGSLLSSLVRRRGCGLWNVASSRGWLNVSELIRIEIILQCDT